MKVSFERKITLGFAIAALTLLVIGGAAWWSATRHKSTFLRVDHTHKTLNELEGVLVDVLSMQSSTRGFVLTGSDDVLTPFRVGDARLTSALDRLRVLTADNPRQHERALGLDPLIEQARQIMRARIAERRARGIEAAANAAELLAGQRAVEGIRSLVRSMQEEERRLLEDRFRRMNIVGRITLTTIIFATIASVAFLGGAGLMARREFAERNRIAESLRESEERFRLMVDAVKDYAIIMLDPNGRVVSWNAGASRIKGYAADEIVGEHYGRFYPPAALAAGIPGKSLEIAAVDGRAEDQGWRARKDGSLFWANVVVTAVRTAEGKLIGFVKVTRDLTASRAAAARIEHLNDNLRRRATLLEAANAELEAFSYSVSHDLRSPLRHIDGFSGLLSKRAGGSLDEESRRYLDVIGRAAQQMGRLIDDLLAFSRIGRTPFQLQDVDQNRLVSEVIAEAGELRHGHVEWRVADLPTVQADAALLRQVWRNLVENALKYSSKSATPRIEIAATRDDANREYVFSVRDNGVGFDMAYADKLFGVFQRLHAPTEFEGTGIGLANVRRIVGRHGGRTWAEGQVNGGATFYFSLPVVAPEQLPDGLTHS